MDKEFDVIDMGDKKAEKFAEAIKNPTSKKIWQFLKKNVSSQNDLSKKLNIPLPTVHYCLRQLIQAGLVEEADYYWSPKGNKVRLYKASKKLMVFAPDKTPFLETHLRAVLGIAIAMIAVLALIAFWPSNISTPYDPQNSQIQTFDSEEAFLEAIKELQSQNYARGGEMVAFSAGSKDVALESAPTAAPTSSNEYSKTNVQVAGVDEADIIKTDGEYIYVTSHGSLFVIKADGDKSKILSETKIENFYANELFINDNRLVVFGNKEYSYDYYAKREGSIREYYGPTTQVRLYDIRNKEEPELLRTLQFQGNYISSRMIKEHVYFAINSYAYSDTFDSCNDVVPLFADVKGEPTDEDQELVASCTSIGYIPYVRPQGFITIAGMSMSDEDKQISKETILGSAENVYASKENFYAVQHIYPEYYWRGGMPRVLEAKIGEPVDPEEITQIKEDQIPRTVITKIAIKNGNVAFKESGTVPGHILNQFSMDEYGGYFRIATTLQDWRTRQEPTNNIYVLDEKLEIAGSITDIAPGETIYSARFMGDKSYLVTFEQVDPLFVIDLSDPKNPKILGKLKIPGFSNYLHPIGEQYLLGIGQEVSQDKEGRFLTQGVKLAIFDVSDIENPIELHKEVVGGRFSSTIASYDHKAVLYDEYKELFVLPVTLTKETGQNTWGPMYETVFQGANIYTVTIEEGFELEGQVKQYSDDEESKFGTYYYGYEIMRSLYIGNTLYTLSNNRLQANDLNDFTMLKMLQLYEPKEYEYGIGIDMPTIEPAIR